MITNEEIVEQLELTAKLLELHNGDTFKIRSYTGTAYQLDKYNERSLAEMTLQELGQLQGVGKSLAAKIVEIGQTGTFTELKDLLEKTPSGVLEMFKIKGIGAKKIGVIWRELGIDNIPALSAACAEGKIAKLKGFGASTQQKIIDAIAFLNSQKGKLRLDKGLALANILAEQLREHFKQVAFSGSLRRTMEVIERIDLLVESDSPLTLHTVLATIPHLQKDETTSSPFVWRGIEKNSGVRVIIESARADRFVSTLFLYSSAPSHLGFTSPSGKTLYQIAQKENFETETAIYSAAGAPYIIPEMREGRSEWSWSQKHAGEELITWEHLKGIVHNHSTYSDGRNTLEEMAMYCKELGFEYLGIADHSQSAAYANGLRPERVLAQQAEIDQLNKAFALDTARPFKILKGIESDILGDGSLDYPDEILATFDYVVASVHSNLTMSQDKAMERLLKAIANPYTTILGHPTGRLLASRAGYPIDHKTIIDACAAHNVVIEINASPWRLDIDWRWIDYCMDKGVLLSINPDAHETVGYHDMHYGVSVGRKGGLTSKYTFNSMSLSEIEAWLSNRMKR